MQPADWIAHDPDPITRAELEGLDDAALAARFAGPLEFGTAGLRGEIGGGESLMNIATVTRTTAGLAAWLLRQVDNPVVVVGCDARHRSSDFHQATCEVLSAAGVKVLRLPAGNPTPLTSFAVRHYGADAGIMITASHNPAKDNGYKVYLGGRVVEDDTARGVQLISPADAEITEAIARIGWADEVARDDARIEDVDPHESYIDTAVSLVGQAPRDLPIVITAMHGVGGELLLEVLRRAGFNATTPVSEQQQPHPDFPTVAFPNPEEEGALDLAVATAKKVGAELILALDPDADRCSVAIPTDMGWEQLSGDRIGALLGEGAARQAGGEGTLSASIVSSQLLGAIAKRHGLNYQPTLTGFKWIGRVDGLVFGYEEAIGYCVDPVHVRDKDGITACLKVADLASRVPLGEFGAEIDQIYGAWVTTPLTIRCEEPEQIQAMVARLQDNPPRELAGSEVVEKADLSQGYRGVPATTGVLLRTAADDRIIVRPSGTEPKLKCYIEVVGQERSSAHSRALSIKAELSSLL